MKLPVLFLFLIIAKFDESESEKQADDNIICVERGDVSAVRRRLSHKQKQLGFGFKIFRRRQYKVYEIRCISVYCPVIKSVVV
jgi:hypothetical protein